MSKKTSAWFAFASTPILALLVAALPARAHHSIAGQFDMTKTVRLTGVVKRLDWVNPHVYLLLEAENTEQSGAVWKLETLPVAMLRKAGIKKQMLMTGETVELDICPARNGTEHLGFVLSIKFPDGERFQFSRDPNGTVSAVP
jgi:hypothetical protein